MKKEKIDRQAGFTLFELLVSISIIGILTALISLSFSTAQKKARDARRVEDMNSVQKAAEQFYAISSTYVYPANTNAPTSWTTGGQVLLEKFPVEPKGTGWTGYVYTVGTTYCACAALENSSNGNSTNNTCSAFASSGSYYCVKSQQ